MDSDSVGDCQKEIQISKSDGMENAKESKEEMGECGRLQEIPNILSPEIRETERSVDSDSVGERQKDIQMCKDDNMENTEESREENRECAMEEEIPKILSPEIHDVFPVFASMLDIKSFMKLALTSKDMYKRCTEDKNIRINVYENSLIVDDEDLTDVNMNSFIVRPSYKEISREKKASHKKNYLMTLRKLPCKVHLRILTFAYRRQHFVSRVDAALRYLKEIGVESIEKLCLMEQFQEWETIIPFIKKYRVREVCLENNAPLPILRTFLTLNIKRLASESLGGEIPVEILLDNDFKIPEIALPSIKSINKDQFMQLLSKVQSGSLRSLIVHCDAVDWNDYDKTPDDGPLPVERPLLIAKPSELFFREYWLLDWQGGVTKCVVHHFSRTLEVFICEPSDYPWILRKEEDVLKDLTERRPRVSCSKRQFESLISTLEKYAGPETGLLPEDRPLFFPSSENVFWLLCEDDSLMKCVWEKGCANWKKCTPQFELPARPSIAKYFFWKRLKEDDISIEASVFCDGIQELDIWLEDYKTYDFDYTGELPSARPLVFERTSSKDRNRRVFLFEHRLVQCKYDGFCLRIKHCTPSNTPSALMTVASVTAILQKSLKWHFYEKVLAKGNKVIPYEMFRDGFEEFKTSSVDVFSEERPFVFEKTTKSDEGEVVDERWFSKDGVAMRKATWRDGRFTVSKEELCHSPIEFIQHLFRTFAEKGCGPRYYLENMQFLDCLEQFNVVPFDYSGPLKSDSPLAFMKNEIRHTCRKGHTRRPRCDCTDVFIRVWFLWEDLRTTYCSWEEDEKDSLKVEFRDSSDCPEMPPFLSSKEYLKFLLKGSFTDTSRFEWLGSLTDLRSQFDGYKTLPPNYDGPLPAERPLLLRTEDEFVYRLLREDGTVIKCDYRP